MKKLMTLCLALSCAPVALAVGNEREIDRIKDAGIVMKEILDIPDDIPRDHLDRAECVIVLPSVMKICVDAETKQILGATILGVGGDEVIHVLLAWIPTLVD